MTYIHKVRKTRAQVQKCERSVQAQRERFVHLQDADTWAARRLLTASEGALQSNRKALRKLLGGQ